jgi:tetratricopeptide (TPR) repeat protein
VSQFDLIVETGERDNVVRFRLHDAHGAHLAGAQVKLSDHSLLDWQGVFDTRNYVERYARHLRRPGRTKPVTDEELLAGIGLFLGEKVLGPDIMSKLQGNRHRTLLVRLPDPQADGLAAAFARVPWEIARTGPHPAPLMAQNLVVRQLLQAGPETADQGNGEGAVRVLLVFAEAPGSRPLAMRLEREQLLDLFFSDILPGRHVEVDALCHGVTRSRLEEQIQARGGYQIIHWSGHGHHNLLELHPEPGQPSRLTGQELVELFTRAGGFIPQLMFLSACLSGTVVSVTDWAGFHAAMAGPRTGRKQAGDRELPELPELLASQPGYTGTALELLKAGVPQVIAMRHAVGDDYARELARHFYKHLLADPANYTSESALALARGELLRDKRPASGFDAVDHATPVLFGQAQAPFQLANQRSPQHARRYPRPQPLLPGGNRELEKHPAFVGRSAELTRLAGQWLPREGPAAALVQGLAGLGKTALAAEAIHLWHPHFDFVFCFQAKPTPLALEEFYRRLDEKLALESSAYRARCDGSPYAKVFLPPGERLSGEARFERLRNNLVDALREDRVLLVLDNYETNLESVAGQDGYRSQDPQWDRLLAELAERLIGTGSRLLITSRHRLAALAGAARALWLPLGPLPMGEAALFLRSHDGLRGLYFADEAGRALVVRLLDVSRGHPLILDRLASLARDRQALTGALDALETKGGWQSLPDLFAGAKSTAQREREHRYLEDVAIGAVDLLIERASPDARRLLWIITLANEPVTLELVEGVWSGRSVDEEQLEQIRGMLELLRLLPEEKQKELEAQLATDEGRELLEALQKSKAGPLAPPVKPLLDELHGAGLIAREGQPMPEEVQARSTYSFHELVRERVAAWMAAHADERGGRTEQETWIAYGQRYATAFQGLQTSGEPGAMERATEAGRRALIYMLRARAFDRLGSFASGLVIGTRDPAVLRAVIGELQAVADQLPPGEDRWSVRTYLADALRNAGRSDEALPLYEQAAAEAEAAGHWSDVGWICQNWANALRNAGQLDKAKATYLRSGEAAQKAGSPRANAVASELEALRVDVKQGRAEKALPQIETRLAEVRPWWKRHRAGESVPEAPDTVFLGRVLVGALDIAEDANRTMERWQAGLDLLKEIEQVKRDMGQSGHELAITRFNQYWPLMRLDRLDDAQRVIESCLIVFRKEEALGHQATALSALASVWKERGNLDQAIALERHALSVCNHLPDPSDRAKSHGNLAIYLEKAEESAQHFLAAGIYRLASGHGQGLSRWLRNLRVRTRGAASSGGQYQLPAVSRLLSLPEFAALKELLEHWQVDAAQLQTQIDQLVEQARREE